MRRNQIDALFAEQTKRRDTIISYICFIVVISILAFSLLFVYFHNNKDYYVTYSEKGEVDYKVFLKENEFFEDGYLGTNKQYIASLIEKMVAEFEYKLMFDTDDVQYKYEYRVDANINVYDSDTNNVIFNKTENLVPKKEYITSERQIKIKEEIEIDYNYFNNLISKFVKIYDLDDSESVLTIDMYVNAVGSCDTFKENQENESVITLSIPLTSKTIAIEISNDLIDTDNNVMLCETPKSNFVILLFALFSLIVDMVIIVYLVNYEKNTRTADTIYLKKLKKILNNYGGYIQEISEDFDVKGYQMIKIKSFEDLLEIRDTIKQPILMKQNKEKTGSYFVIPSNFKYLYIYRMRMEDFEA